MKSLMEEASSITKAIESAWIRAGKPQSFSIKILEEPQKNFFGFTSKQAKIALFFEEVPVVAKHERKERQLRTLPHNVQQPPPDKKIIRTDMQQQRMKAQPRREVRTWNNEMIATASTWIADYLRMLNREHLSYTTTPNKHQLIIRLQAPITGNAAKEQAISTSLSYLIMSSIRNKFKHEAKGLILIVHST